MPRHSDETRDQVMAETRRNLLAAAANALATDGYNKANVNQIAKDAGFSIGTFYNYFPSKRALMQAFIDEISQAHVYFISEHVRLENDPDRQIESFFKVGFEFITANLAEAKAIFNTLNGPDEEFKLQLFQAYQPLFDLVNEILTRGNEQGSFHLEDREAAVRLVMLIYLGTAAQLNRDGKHWLSPDQVSGFVLKSLRYQEKE